MHAIAWISAHLFFTYLSNTYRQYHNTHVFNILDVGSSDILGSMRDSIKYSVFAHDHFYNYVGLDRESGSNVDIVQTSNWNVTEEYDIIISSSCFEHDDLFWVTFLSMLRSLKPGGFIYLDLPSAGPVHRFPVDNWRFYPDSAHSLLKWALHNNIPLHLLHTSTLPNNQSDSSLEWGDTTMIFWKEGNLFSGDSLSAFETVAQLHQQYKTFKYDLLLRIDRHLSHVRRSDRRSDSNPFIYSGLNSTELLELHSRDEQVYGQYSLLPNRYDFQFHPKLSSRLTILLLNIQHRNNFYTYHCKGYPIKYRNESLKFVYNYVLSIVENQWTIGSYAIPLLVPVTLRNDAGARRELARSFSQDILFQYNDISYHSVLKIIDYLLCGGPADGPVSCA